MTNKESPRRALADLPVNAFGNLGAIHLKHEPLSQKRRIQEVDDPAFPPAPSRLCLPQMLSPFSQQTEHAMKYTANCSSERMSHIDNENNSCTNSTNSEPDIDTDTIAGSQRTAATEFSPRTPSTTSPRLETLRARLRVAMFKVQTNQTHIPLSQLRIPSQPTLTQGLQSSPKEPELPRLLPAPVLKPTSRSTHGVPQMLSSPPSSTDNSPMSRSEREKSVFRTPALPRQRVQMVRGMQQTSSPPDSQGEGFEPDEDEGLRSSGVKGRAAAIGLLGLREERR
ncbi:MAG: hypothetical protein Q9167_000839 [Letrouitia subvulpina]